MLIAIVSVDLNGPPDVSENGRSNKIRFLLIVQKKQIKNAGFKYGNIIYLISCPLFAPS